MGFSDAIRAVLSNYFRFNGRAGRPEYWWWVLGYTILVIITSLIDAFVIGPALGFEMADENAGNPLTLIVVLALAVPSLAVSVRRLHDIDRSGWWLLIALIPVVGTLIVLYWHIQQGDADSNQYGIPSG